MKKFLFAFIAGCIPALAVTNGAYAQDSNNMAATEFPRHVFKMDKTITGEKDNTVNMDAISSKEVKDLKKSYKELKRSYNAVKDFKNSYKEISDATWFKISDGYMAEFTSHGINNKIFFDKAGNWTASLKSYDEDKLAGDVRDIVKGKYPGYKINYVQEIETAATRDLPTYIVYLEDAHNMKQVRVSGDEMDVYKEFTKQ